MLATASPAGLRAVVRCPRCGGLAGALRIEQPPRGDPDRAGVRSVWRCEPCGREWEPGTPVAHPWLLCEGCKGPARHRRMESQDLQIVIGARGEHVLMPAWQCETCGRVRLWGREQIAARGGA
jgi:hypothetical protein